MAASGQYAKGFVDAGQFDAIEHYGKKGDVYIISIGINDTNYSDSTEYYNTVTDMVKRAKKKGMEVILVKQQGRKGDYTKNPLLTSRWFAAELDKIGKEQNVKVVDLFNLFQNYCVSIGTDKADALFYDNIHPNRQGALKLAELFAMQIDWNSVSDSEPGTPVTPPQTDAVMLQDGAMYMLKNANSGLYMEVSEATATNGMNVQQGTENNSGIWKAVSAGNGYYYLYTQSGDGKTFVLDVSGKKTEDGTNIEIYTYKGGDNQQFKFVKNSDNTYSILTKISGDASCIEIEGKSTEKGGNVQQWKVNGGNNQKWILEPIAENIQNTTTPATTITTPINTTTAMTTQEKIVYGDVNCDGSVDIADAAIVKLYIINPNKYTLSSNGIKNADVHNVGNGINIQDVLAIQSYVINRISMLPVGN